MNIEQLINETRTVHNFDASKKVSDDIIKKSLEVSMLAPNHRMTFPWNFKIIGPETRNKIIKVILSMKVKEGSPADLAQRIEAKMSAPSHMIAVVQKVKENSFEMKEDYATLSCSIQLTALYLRSQGIAYKWSTSGFTTHIKTYALLGLNPQANNIIGFILVGHELETPFLKPRPDVETIISYTD